MNLSRVSNLGVVAKRLLGLMIFVGSISFSSMLSAQDLTLEAVSVEGNQRIETETILSILDISAGQSLSAADVNTAVQRLRETDLFEEVDAALDGARLIVVVDERPTVNLVAFEGNAEFSDEQLDVLVRTRSRFAFDPAEVRRDVRALLQAYIDQGRLGTTIEPQIIERSDNRVDVAYVISESDVVEVEQIAFIGNKAFSDRRLRRVMATKQAGLLRQIIKSDTFVEDRIEFDKQLLRDFYQSRGYVDFRVVSVSSGLSLEQDEFFLTFNVIEGQQFNIGGISMVSERDDINPERLEGSLLLSAGMVYSPEAIENAISRAEEEALRQQLQFVRIVPRLTRNSETLTIDVEFAITQGPRLFVERIDITGNTTTFDRVIRRQFIAVEGDPFNPRAIREAAERIRALGFFGDVNVDTREGSSPEQIIVEVSVVDQPTGSLSFGGNFSSDTGFGFLASFQERNFLGRGQRLNLGLETNSDRDLLSLSFREPAVLERDLQYDVSFNYTETSDENDSYSVNEVSILNALTYPIGPLSRLTLSTTIRQDEIKNAAALDSEIILAEEALGRRSAVGLGYLYSYDTRRAGFSPITFYTLRFGQDAYSYGSDGASIRSTLFAGAETEVWGEEISLRTTLRAGNIVGQEDDTIRVIDRFSNSMRVLRGFSGRSVGPREVSGDESDYLGAENYAVLSLEAEFPIGLPEEYGITGAAFVDYGSYWGLSQSLAATSTRSLESVEFEARSVAGLALLWSTPIGPLRFNFTRALKSLEGDDVSNFDVTISTNF